MKKELLLFSVTVLIVLFFCFPGSRVIYASRYITSNAFLLKAYQKAGIKDLKVPKPRDFKIPDGNENDSTPYSTDRNTSGIDEEDKIDVSGIDFPKGKKLVVIDPGHGGVDPGTNAGNLFEKDINLDICLRLNSILKRSGIVTYMTRTKDTSLKPKERILTANKLKASLFVSVHNNWFKDSSLNGTMTLFYPSTTLTAGDLTGAKFAQVIQNELAKALETKSRGITDREDLSVLKQAEMPSVLVELGFLSNSKDAKLLGEDSFRQEAAEALAVGIKKALAKID